MDGLKLIHHFLLGFIFAGLFLWVSVFVVSSWAFLEYLYIWSLFKQKFLLSETHSVLLISLRITM